MKFGKWLLKTNMLVFVDNLAMWCTGIAKQPKSIYV